jgi:hypothetical protein
MVNNVWAMSSHVQSRQEEIVPQILPQIVPKLSQKCFFDDVLVLFEVLFEVLEIVPQNSTEIIR